MIKYIYMQMLFILFLNSLKLNYSKICNKFRRYCCEVTSRHSPLCFVYFASHTFRAYFKLAISCDMVLSLCIWLQVQTSHSTTQPQQQMYTLHLFLSLLLSSALCFNILFTTRSLVSLHSTLTSYRTQSLVLPFLFIFHFCHSLAHTRSFKHFHTMKIQTILSTYSLISTISCHWRGGHLY